MGLDAALDRFWEVANARRLGIDAVEVVADNGVHRERRRIDDIRRDVFSVSKTVTSLAIGMLESEGVLSLDDAVLAHLPKLADTAAAGSETITVGHLLRMTAGNGYRWLDDDADHPGDPARDFLATPLMAEPGSTYHYSGGNTYVLSRVVHSITGVDLRDFLVPRLFGPLGIRNPQWLRCPLGFPLGAIGLQLRTSEITRITQLLLHEGTYGGHRLVPGDYIARMTADTTHTGRAEPDNRTYGLHCMCGCAPATGPGAWTASTGSSESCSLSTMRVSVSWRTAGYRPHTSSTVCGSTSCPRWHRTVLDAPARRSPSALSDLVFVAAGNGSGGCLRGVGGAAS
jgi:CubicO group peptidase (beta-lactamase class C family)